MNDYISCMQYQGYDQLLALLVPHYRLGTFLALIDRQLLQSIMGPLTLRQLSFLSSR